MLNRELKRMDILLSIIIPVYNVEPYLERCLSTVVSCELTSCEIILSLGKSADRSGEICLDYGRKYPFVQILEQSGKGLSNARNCGMDIARGEYILFLDSDDYVDSQCLNSLIGQLRDGSIAADVVVTDFYRSDLRLGRMVSCFQIGEEVSLRESMDFLPHMLRRRQCFWNVWRYLYRRNFLEQNEIRFMENRLSEDIDFTTSVFVADPKIIFTHSPYYVYVVGRGQSLMDRPNLKRLSDTVFILERSIARLRESQFLYADRMIAQFQFEYILNLALAVEIEPSERRKALALYQNWRQTLTGSLDPAVRWARRLISIVRIKPAGYGLHCLKLLRRRMRKYLSREKREI